MSLCEQCRPLRRYGLPPPAGSRKEVATREGGSGIGIVGARDMGSMLVGVATGLSQLRLEEVKWTI